MAWVTARQERWHAQLGQPDEDPLGAADVAEPLVVAVLGQPTDEFGAVRNGPPPVTFPTLSATRPKRYAAPSGPCNHLLTRASTEGISRAELAGVARHDPEALRAATASDASP